MAKKKQTADEVAVTDEATVAVTDETTADTNTQIDDEVAEHTDEVMLETAVLDEIVEPEPVAETASDPLALAVTNHGNRYWDMVNKNWIESGYNFLNFESEIKKTKLINNLTQVNILAGYDRFEWVA